jgi:hypothetical protein
MYCSRSVNISIHDFIHAADSCDWHRFAASSFCRTGNYGMPQFVTNTMRLCTREASSSAHDAYVPVKPVFYARGNSTSPVLSSLPEEMSTNFDEHWRQLDIDGVAVGEACSINPYQVPWTMEDKAFAENAVAGFSVGCVPMWDGQSPASQQQGTYPMPKYNFQLKNVDAGTLEQGSSSWGDSCTEGGFMQCTRDSDCNPLQPQHTPLQCKFGACVVHTRPVLASDSSSGEALLQVYQTSSCYSHRDCKEAGLMCSGDGRCVESVLQVRSLVLEAGS